MTTKSRKRAYAKPVCELLITEIESLLQTGSGNAGTIGGGGVSGDAKRWNGNWEEEEENEENEEDGGTGFEYSR